MIRVALEAEQLGYYDVGGNDHLSTMRFIREAWTEPPDFYEPLITLSNIAARTSVIRLTTGILVLPMRDPVLLAKQVATLDQLSNGRVILGVAVGGYRDEFEGVVPDLADASRAGLAAEGIEALRGLWNDRRFSYAGKYRRFDDVESYPKPVQNPLPIYSGGNVEGSLRRAGELCDGWLPAKVGPDKIRAGREKVAAYARAAGRDPSEIVTALQSVVCLGDTRDQVRERFERSAFDLFRRSLAYDDDQRDEPGRLLRREPDRYAGRGVRQGRGLPGGRAGAFLRDPVRRHHGRRTDRPDAPLRPARDARLPVHPAEVDVLASAGVTGGLVVHSGA